MKRTIGWAFLAAFVACGPAAKVEEPEHDEHAAAETEEGAAEGLLTVDPEVLRDLKLTTFPAELRPAGVGVTALGELKVDETAYAEAGSPIPARVTALLAAPGDSVRRGQALAELQSTELGRARADHTAAVARAELAGKTVARKRSLAADRIVPQGELQRAEAEAEEAKAEERAASASLAALGVTDGSSAADLSRFVLRAPLAGTVLERRAALGAAADPSTPLFRIAELSRLWLVVQAAERDAVRLRVGARARITLAALPGESLTGAISFVGSEVDPHSRTVPVRIVLENPGGRLKPGMFATAFLPVGSATDQVVAVPAVALQRLEDRWVVFLPKGEGRFEVRPVARGRNLGDEVAIVSGLAPGEPVVAEGAFILRAEAEKSAGGAEHHHH